MLLHILFFISLKISLAAKNDVETSITNDNINDFYPALMLEKVSINGYYYTLPTLVESYHDITRRPYSTLVLNNGIYLCPVADKKLKKSTPEAEEETQFNVQDYCLFEKKFKTIFGPFLCDTEVKPLIVELQQEEYDYRVNCDANSNYYAFVYRDCGSHKWQEKAAHSMAKYWNKNEIAYASKPVDFTTYNFCYNFDKMETTYTKYFIESPRLFQNTGTKRERELTFEMKTDGYGIFSDNFEKIKNAYDKENKYEMIGQMLVPSDDMALSLLRKPTFHYVNVKPMQRKLVEIWNAFNTRLKVLTVRENLQYIEIYTKTFGALVKDGDQIYLDEDRRVMIPEIWSKVAIYTDIYPKSYALVFIMHNFYDQSEPIADKYCSEDRCNLYDWLEIKNEQMAALVEKYAYCCELSKKIANLFLMYDHYDNYGIGKFVNLTKSEFDLYISLGQ